MVHKGDAGGIAAGDSGPLPGEYGATDLTGLAGKVCAIAFVATRLVAMIEPMSRSARTGDVREVCMNIAFRGCGLGWPVSVE